jgi:hypothetical protein
MSASQAELGPDVWIHEQAFRRPGQWIHRWMGCIRSMEIWLLIASMAALALASRPVTYRKDDASTAHQGAFTKVAGRGSLSEGGGFIHTTSG